MDTPSLERLLDGLIDAYIDWRDACDEVTEAYRWWTRELGRSNRSAFATYVATLDAEQRAAEAYAALVRRTHIRLWGEGSPPEALGGRREGVGR